MKGGVRLFVSGDFLQKQAVLAEAFLFGHHLRIMGQHVEPAHHARNHREDEEDDQRHAVDDLCRFRRGRAHLMGDEGENGTDDGDRHAGGQHITPEAGRHPFDDLFREEFARHGTGLCIEAGLRLAHVVAAAVERAA